MTSVYGSSTYIDSIHIDCRIDEKGTAHFTETWDMFVQKGTEGYKVFDNMIEQPISLVDVEDENNTQYTILKEWNVKGTLEEKKNKCGMINSESHYELCFGLGSYGHHAYTMEYTIDHFVNQYQDVQGIDFSFVSQMSLSVKKVTIDIYSDQYSFKSKRDEIYGYGFVGSVEFKRNGHAYIKTSQEVEKSNLIVTIKMSKSNYSDPCYYQYSKKFNDVLTGKKYTEVVTEEESTENSLGMIAIVVGGIILAVLLLSLYTKRMNRNVDVYEDGIRWRKEDVSAYPLIPCDKDISRLYYMGREAGIIDSHSSGVMAAIVYKWFFDHDLTYSDHDHVLKLKQMIQYDNEFEKELIDYFRKVTNDHNEINTGDLITYSQEHQSKINSLLDRIYEAGSKFYDNEYYRKVVTENKKVFLFFDQSVLTRYKKREYRHELNRVYGFYLYLKSEDNLSEKALIDVRLWETYLQFATILGVGEELEAQIPKVCPMFNRYIYDHYHMYYDDYINILRETRKLCKELVG